MACSGTALLSLTLSWLCEFARLLCVWTVYSKITTLVCNKDGAKSCYIYCGCHLGDQNKGWVPHVCCVLCCVNFFEWVKGKKSMLFAVPMIQCEPTSNLEYSLSIFCLMKIVGFSRSSKNKIQYPNIRSAVSLSY
jgi:hypothetical protein